MNVVIIGSGAGGLTTASNIKKYSANAKITILTEDKHIAYSPCAIPYVIGGEIEKFENIVMHTPKDYERKGIEVITESKVVDVVANQNIVIYEEKGIKKEISYEKLVIATGGTPFIPPIDGVNLKGVFKVRTIEDGQSIKEWTKTTKQAVVAGAGAIGLEMAFGLKEIGIDVTVVEMVPQVFPRALDPEMAKIVQEYLEENGIRIILEKPLGKIIGNEKVKAVIIGEEQIDTELVIMSTGVRSNIELAKLAGCEIGRWAILTNNLMQTSIENIYAVGDCVEVIDAITGQNTLSPFGTTAVRQGKVAAKSIAGIDAESSPVLNSMVSKIGALEIGGTGMTETAAKMNGIDVVIGNAKALTRARYYPGGEPIFIKLVCEKNSRRIIGCQIISKERVAERVDAMSIAISKKMTVDELLNQEFSYAPPVSMVIDPLTFAAEDAFEKF
ncbi:FAD-dependent pyridine nucleotide-disulphide oxidoreductase [Methanococcus vannielii SB]|jgi:NADH oxidase (H2O2-forming)|uniref:FAD-dependent pyridine nucleotide-disulphide oxidoreductase n=1 Tax=Methanococcus vannielii (strain ATCC 35089 / DSM 1224 / JCM 13029 / OCM 148 / SB) TaxID=406327 RepID=A6UPQ7_METVS|nr:FAD-dependent oxidoreductase [Methanococcus vannielii]ABR54479.1 FAD-dependent pyridine nucleotide-disulphide oxidoreductase [Methanococcus vannielii SB]